MTCALSQKYTHRHASTRIDKNTPLALHDFCVGAFCIHPHACANRAQLPRTSAGLTILIILNALYIVRVAALVIALLGQGATIPQ